MTTDALQTTDQQRPLRTQTPRADIYAVEAGYQAQLELPGVASDDLHITLEHSTLTVRAQTRPIRYAGSEANSIEALAYERHFRLSDAIDGSAIQAELKDGLLTLTLPKAERAQPRTIPVALN